MDFQLIPTDVLVLCHENPLSFTDDRQELNVTPAGKFVEGARVVTF